MIPRLVILFTDGLPTTWLTRLWERIAVTYGIVGMRANSSVIEGSSTIFLNSGKVESSSAGVLRIVDVGRFSVDESNHIVFPVTDMISHVHTTNPGTVSANCT